MFANIKARYKEFPVNVQIFLKRGVILLTGWLLLYHLILKPIDIPDRQFTFLAQYCTAQVLSLFYDNVQLAAPHIFIGGRDIVIITNPCNGLELFALYLGFLLCIPASKKRFWAFAIVGTAVIFAINILRCTGLAVMSYNHSTLTDFAHHYAFKLIVYAVAFYGWVLYSKKEKKVAHA